MKLKKIRGFIKFVLNFLFPIECVECGREGAWLCRECLHKIPLKTLQFCPKCLNINKTGLLCAKCHKQHPIDRLWIATNYSHSTVEKLIKGLKYRFAYELSVPLTQILLLLLREQKLRLERDFPKLSNFIIIPVPIHKKRLKWRGFNQSELLARHLSRALKLDLNTKLLKTIDTKPQADIKAKDTRQVNVINSFEWRGEELKGKKIILVDDITTTESTIKECAKTLKKAGAKHVWALIIAKG